MLRHGPKLDKQQILLGRYVDIGTELFATSAAVAYASELIARITSDDPDAVMPPPDANKTSDGKTKRSPTIRMSERPPKISRNLPKKSER